VEEDPLEWAAWIPYVLMAYRNRINSITKLTPFELVFGRKMNGFEAWNNDSGDEAVALLKRSVELRILLDHTHPQLIDKLKTNQRKQEEVQDKRTKPVEKPLNVGQTVYIKSMNLVKPKLPPVYHGPYTIAGRDNNGNYILQSRRGVNMRQKYPISQLKVVTEEGLKEHPESFEVEEIRDHRIRRGRISYFVKWTGLPEEECSWVILTQQKL
jgi:hypothetical protein